MTTSRRQPASIWRTSEQRLRSGVRRPGPALVTGSVFGSREKAEENRLGPTVRYDDMRPRAEPTRVRQETGLAVECRFLRIREVRFRVTEFSSSTASMLRISAA